MYSSDGLELVFYDATYELNATTQDRMVNAFFTVYPKEVATYNANASKKVTFIIDPRDQGVAGTMGDVVVFSAAYLASNPSDIDVVTHECMHIVQAYKGGNEPGWAVEGIADYVRYTLGVDNAGAGWTLPAFDKSQKYTDGYRVTARFFLWIEKKVKAGFVKAYNQALREGTGRFFQTFIGKTVDQLWAQYAQNPAIPGL
ncbi:hypothetical protein AAVH_31870 [Aphelenchoides avenae]|nr:hypothetical protein AAVH_31870 [Aphelenchus avenae]